MDKNVMILRISIISLFLILKSGLSADNPKMQFSHFTTETGLSGNMVTAFLQDSRGYLWITTKNGLNRYDGYSVEVFKHDPRDPSSLADNFVTGLHEDSRGSIWIAMTTPGVVNRFDTHHETFQRFMLPQRQGGPQLQQVNPGAIVELGANQIWVGTYGSGLFLINPSIDAVEQLDTGSPRQVGLSSDGISNLHIDDGDRTAQLTGDAPVLFQKRALADAPYAIDIKDSIVGLFSCQ